MLELATHCITRSMVRLGPNLDGTGSFAYTGPFALERLLLLSKSEDILMAIPLYLTHCRLTHLKPDPCNVHLDRQARLLLYPHLRFAFLTLIFVFLDLSSSAHRPYAPMVTSRPTRVYSHSNAAPLLCAAWGEDSSTLLFLSQWTICFHPSRSACALGSRPQSTAPPENLKLGAA